MNIIDRIIRIFALKRKKRDLQEEYKSLEGSEFSEELQKNIISDGVEATFNSKNKELINRVKSEIDAIVVQTQCDPEKLLNYVKATSTPVYRIRNAKNLLKNIKEETGFICEKKGFEAIYLSMITFNGIKFSTPPMFLLENTKQDRLDILYHFYKWYSMKSGLSGFDFETQKQLKKYYNNPGLLSYKKLKLEKIIKLQEAISRDNEASYYVLDYEKKTSVSKKVADKISQDGSASI